ncbi:MAG: multiheme c-type cytochrome [Planctomycetota bacterium]
MSRRMTFVRALRGTGVDPILMDGGDFLFKSTDYLANSFQRNQLREKARLIVECYNRIGYRVAAVGEADLALGLKTLLELKGEMKFPLVCANLVRGDADEPIFEPSTVIEQNGLRVGVVGVLTDVLSPTYVERTVKGGKVLAPLAAARKEVERLRSDVDILWVLAHVDRTVAREIAALPGVDMVLEPNAIGSNHIIWLLPGEHFTESDGRLLVRADGQGSHMSRVDAYVRGRGLPWRELAAEVEGAVNRYQASDHPLGPQFGVDPTLQRMIDAFRDSTQFVSDPGSDEFKPSTKYLTAATCVACHPEQHAFWKNTAHGRAYDTLVKTNDQFRLDCLPCHVVGYGETFIDPKASEPYRDVQCESCHGTNPEHPANPAGHPWPRVDTANCWGCHNPQETQVLFEPLEALPKVACPPLRRN